MRHDWRTKYEQTKRYNVGFFFLLFWVVLQSDSWTWEVISNLNGQYDLHKLSNIQFGAIPRHSRGVIRGDSLKSNFPPELTCTLNTNTNTAPCVFLSIPAELQLCMGCGQADQGLPACGRRASPWMSSDCRARSVYDPEERLDRWKDQGFGPASDQERRTGPKQPVARSY